MNEIFCPDIVRAAIVLLERLIVKVIQKVMDFKEKVIGKNVDAIKETPKETEIHVHVKDESAARTDKQKIPFPVNPHQETDVQNKEQPQQKSITEVKKSVIEQMKAGQKSVPADPKRLETERPPQPSVLASKYSRLKEIDSRLKDQNKAIFLSMGVGVKA